VTTCLFFILFSCSAAQEIQYKRGNDAICIARVLYIQCKFNGSRHLFIAVRKASSAKTPPVCFYAPLLSTKSMKYGKLNDMRPPSHRNRPHPTRVCPMRTGMNCHLGASGERIPSNESQKGNMYPKFDQSPLSLRVRGGFNCSKHRRIIPKDLRKPRTALNGLIASAGCDNAA
jgi:hypothetical protein